MLWPCSGGGALLLTLLPAPSLLAPLQLQRQAPPLAPHQAGHLSASHEEQLTAAAPARQAVRWPRLQGSPSVA